MNVFSGFDGLSAGQIALNRANIKYNNYYASEIDKFAIKITQKNFPSTVQLGDINKINISELPKIDLVLAGSPCQGFSFAGKQLNFNDNRSKLFFVFVEILNQLKKNNPDLKFLFENVKMSKESENIISKFLNINPIQINSNLLTAQNRIRLYWTNILTAKDLFQNEISIIPQPEKKNILLKNILQSPGEISEKFYLSDNMIEYFTKRNTNFNNGNINIKSEYDKASCLTANYSNPDISDNFIIDANNKISQTKTGAILASYNKRKKLENFGSMPFVVSYTKDTKGKIKNYHLKNNCNTLTQSSGSGNNTDQFIINDLKIRKLTPVECERLQTIPDNYTEGVSNTQRYKMIGNSWTVDVITHILKYL